jgi:pyruvate,water dikinase
MTPPAFLGEPSASSPAEGESPEPAEDLIGLRGMGSAKGEVTGIARVARTLDEARNVQPGEILVTITTLPPWAPLFGVVAAVVTETGGPLSHCAIVAREYGIPAVVGVPGATQRIATGQRIFVDGAAGVVTLLS